MRPAALHSASAAAGNTLPSTWLRRVVVIWFGQALSVLSTYAATYAGIWYITETTSSPAMLSLAAIVSLIPQSTLAPFAGILADRFKKKSILIAADAFVLVLTLTFAMVVSFGYISIVLVLLFGALRSATEAFHMPALESATPFLVPDSQLIRINSINQGIWSLSLVVGPALGIFFYTLIGLQAVLLLNAAGVLVALVALLVVTFPETHVAANLHERKDEMYSSQTAGILQGAFAGLKEGFLEVFNNKGLFILVVFVMVDMAVYISLDSFYPLVTYKHFSGTGFQASLVEAVYGIASLIGLAILFVWQGGSHLMRVVGVSAAATGILTIATGFLPSDAFIIFVALTGMTGVVESLFTGPIMTIVQRHVDSSKLGRVMGLYTTITGLSSPLGIGVAGLVAEQTGVMPWFVIAGGITMAIGILILALRSVQALDM